jgi:hypothetical protein
MVAALPAATFETLKPHAIDIRVNIDPVHWFLSPAKDTRSSLYLEDAATEFQVQGLELDWTIVTWDADLRWSGDDWSYHSFRGAKWTDVKKPERRQYLKNAYRVLLTRARQGMVIFVPPGAKRDKTRSPGWPIAPLYWQSIMPPLQRIWCKDRLVAHGPVAM